MKTLICGAKGQLGRSLQELLSQGSFVALSHQDLDITDLEAVKTSLHYHRPDVVINASAYNQVDLAESEQKKAFEVNEKGPKNLAIISSEINSIFVHVSTDYVFDGMKREPFDEEDEPNPLSVYAQSKLAGEKATLENCRRSYVVRTAWVYREGGNNFLKKMYDLSQKGEFKVVSDQYGSPTYAPHLARAIMKLVKTNRFGLYHLAGSGQTTRYEMLKKFFEMMKFKVNFEPVSKREFKEAAKRPDYSVLTTCKNPSIILPPWEEGLQEFCKNF